MNFVKIESSSLSNGTGWRVVLWCSGCEHHCYNCHNKETWNPEFGKRFTEKEMNLILELLSKDYIQGLTFSGGDPLFPGNRDTVAQIARRVKEVYPDKDIWMYTGYKYEDVKNLPVMEDVDVLVDGKYINSLRDVSLPFRGSSNQRIIDVQKSRSLSPVVLLYE